MKMQKVLMELGERLVSDYGFTPSTLQGEKHISRTCEPIHRFLIWLEHTPEAKQVLTDMRIKVEVNQ